MNEEQEPDKRIRLQDVVTMGELVGECKRPSPQPNSVVRVVSRWEYIQAQFAQMQITGAGVGLLMLAFLLFVASWVMFQSRLDVYSVSKDVRSDVSRQYPSFQSSVPPRLSSRIGYTLPPDEGMADKIVEAMQQGKPGPAIPSTWWVENLFFLVGFPAGIYLCWRGSWACFKQVASVNVVPLTRANAADLPAPDSLVRAKILSQK
jgi:hypothetical protein